MTMTATARKGKKIFMGKECPLFTYLLHFYLAFLEDFYMPASLREPV